MDLTIKKAVVEIDLHHKSDEVVNQDADESWKKIFGRAPDAVKHNADSSEKWYYLTYVGGCDEEGPYSMVTDGPAAGERVYV